MLSLKTMHVNNLNFLAGAMRLPGGVDEPDNRPHFLTDAYIQKFKLGIKKFTNFDPNGISNIYGFKAKSTGTYIHKIELMS